MDLTVMRQTVFFLVLTLACGVSYAQGQKEDFKRSGNVLKKTVNGKYEEVDFEDLIRRYMGKEKSDPLEGIYSVSCVITKTSKRFLSKRDRVKVVARKDNYARVAILRDWPGSKRDFIEVTLSYRDAKKYPIVGELMELSEGRGFIYRHFEPDGSNLDFSMLTSSVELLEGEFSEMHRRKTITYKLSYLKLFPKAGDVVAGN